MKFNKKLNKKMEEIKKIFLQEDLAKIKKS